MTGRMKQALGLIALLVAGCNASALALPRQDDGAGEAYRPSCDERDATIEIRDWRGVKYDNDTHIFDFELYVSVSRFTTPCHGMRVGDELTWDPEGWFECDVRDDEAGLSAGFSFVRKPVSLDDFIFVNHTFQCDRGEAETIPRNRIAKARLETKDSIYLETVDVNEGNGTGTEMESAMLSGGVEVPHRLPRLDCSAASEDVEWEIRDFDYHAFWMWVTILAPWQTITYLQWDLYNSANDYLVACDFYRSATVKYPNEDDIFGPDERLSCFDDDLWPAEDYPTTYMIFDKASNNLTIEQSWKYDDDGEETAFSVVGSKILPLECVDERPENSIPDVTRRDCEHINTTIKADSVRRESSPKAEGLLAAPVLS
ncbi:hypothetical protein GGR52DRAFT_375479 [Hypoxylon sp. FL1284]|nr:hypothetical protein GGR52DRAFT_375479 [Hypoxylon sp. FL1284]